MFDNVTICYRIIAIYGLSTVFSTVSKIITTYKKQTSNSVRSKTISNWGETVEKLFASVELAKLITNKIVENHTSMYILSPKIPRVFRHDRGHGTVVQVMDAFKILVVIES